MSRSKRNWDHLIDDLGNYALPPSARRANILEAFCSFNSDDVDAYYASHNVIQIETSAVGFFEIYFDTHFPDNKYNVEISANGGFYRTYHVTRHPDYAAIQMRNKDNDPAGDSFITFRAWRPR